MRGGGSWPPPPPWPPVDPPLSKFKKQKNILLSHFRYIDDVLHVSSVIILDYISEELGSQLKIQQTDHALAQKWDNYLDLSLEFDEDGRLYTRLYDKYDGFHFSVVNFQYLRIDIPESPAYGVFVSQLISYAQVCFKYEEFL